MQAIEDGVYPYNFGALSPLPDGYCVGWVESIESFVAFGPDDWESVQTCRPHQARRWCFERAALRRAMGEKVEPR